MDDEVYILLGVGGTGAKVVEAALVMMAAGIGPSNVHVGLIDQDQSNGNVARTRALLQSIAAFRQAWNNSSDANYVDWAAGKKDPVTVGSVNAVPLFPDEDNALWCPEKNNAHLRSIIGSNLDDDRKKLFDLLFMRGPEEQDLPLGKGYRGRAHVGATALVSAIIENESALMARLRTLMEDPNRRKVNVFVVGSAFGGTGAAGFPTLARALHRLRSANDFTNRNNVTLGGMLMLPYFSFNDDKDGDGAAVVTSDELLPKAQLALEYYNNLFENERAFDHFYSLGWGNLFHLGYHEAGAAEQSNPALPPELFAASAVFDFFERAGIPSEQGSGTRVMVSSRHDYPIRWKDLPNGKMIEQHLGQFLRFAVYWNYIVEGMIDETTGIFGLKKNWVQKLAQGAKAIAAEGALGPLRNLIDQVITWAATIEKTGGKQWAEGPWSLRDFVEVTDDPTKPVKRLSQLSHDTVYDGFDRLVRIDSGEFVPRAGASLYNDLEGGRIDLQNDSKGLGRALATVAKASSLRGE
jgi:hypothetical protein